jgi:Protein of unknown function (DUF3182)
MPTIAIAPDRVNPGGSVQPTVAFYRSAGQTGPHDHDAASKAKVAESLAALLGWQFSGDFEPAQAGAAPVYLVPSDTLESLAEATRLGVLHASDLFGGIVPAAFIATKVIAHPLLHAGSPAPAGWSAACGEQMRRAVLPGYSVFCADDARAAAARLLQHGGVRLKDPAGVGGVGQWVLRDAGEIDEHLERIGPERLASHGLVLERNLHHVTTYSVGYVEVGGLRASYHGTQRLTRNHHGHEVYGGSRLVVSRGGLDDLLNAGLAGDVREAIEKALVFHRAAMGCFPGLVATRCNYDVARGVDDEGLAHCGVLEQSWRIGGASGAEAAALHALQADPSLQRVCASTCEIYADEVTLPPGAWVLYDGPDRQGGRLVKYVEVTADVDT